jgi:hypothetical protein
VVGGMKSIVVSAIEFIIAATKVIGASFIGPFARARSRSAAMNAISLCDAARASAVMSSET